MIANSLVPTTGVFSRQFPCDQLDTGQAAYTFEWELRNSDGNLVAGTQAGALTLVNDPACVTSITATLTGPLTEVELFATPAPTVTVELDATEYVDPLDTSRFTVTENIPGVVTISSVARTSATVATLTLAYNNVDIAAPGIISITVLAAGHTNSGDLRTNNLIITPRPGVNICGRTPQVRDAIVAASLDPDDTDCTAVNGLATITNLSVTGQGITALQSGDFAGMTMLTTLGMNDNQLTTLPADIFAGLTALGTLELANNNLSSLAPATFAGLTMLAQLNMDRNQLTTLPAAIFNGLGALVILDLSSNQIEELPATVFDQLDAVTTIRLNGNPFTPATGLPAGIFDEIVNTITGAPGMTFIVDDIVRAGHFVCSRDDAAAIVAATTDVDDCLRITTTELNTFVQTDTALSALTISAGVLTPAFNPATNTYTVAVQNSVASVTVTPTIRQSGATITVAGATTASGNASAALMLPAGTPLAVEIIVTAPDRITMATYTVTVSRPADTAAAATLTGTLTETNLFAGDVDLTLELTGTLFETGVAAADFRIRDSIDGDLSVASVTLTGSTTSTATVSLTHSGEDITALGTVTMTLLASGHTGSDNLATNSLMITASAGANICGRTPQVRDRIVFVSSASECTNLPDLATITIVEFSLNNMNIAALQSGDFAGLTGLTNLVLSNNPLTTLPAGIFDDLGSVRTLNLMGNQLEELPPGIFDELDSISTLRLEGNRFTAGTGLPPGIFDEILSRSPAIIVDDNVRAAHFVCSRDDADDIVTFTSVTTLVTDCLRITTAQLTAFTNTDASLRALTLSVGDLRPAFDPEVTAYNVAVAANVGSITVRPTANESAATTTVNGARVGIGFSSAPIALTAGTAVPITIVVTGGDGSAERTYTIMVTRGGGVAALVGTLTEASLFSTTAPTVTVTLQRTEFVDTADLSGDDFTVGDTLAGTVSLSDVTRTSATEATLTLAYDNVDITGGGISITVLASGHTGSGDLLTNTIPVTASGGTNICGRTALVRDSIVAVSSATECTSITDLATITTLIAVANITSLQSGDFAGMSGLRDLLLSGSLLTALPAGIFDGLTALENLALTGNPFTADTGLPAGIFDDVLDTLGPVAATGLAGLAVDDVGRAAHFVCSSLLADVIVAVTSGVDNCLRITTAQLTAFPMIDTTLSALTISDGNLVPAFDPLTDTYTVAVLTTEASVTVTPTANQSGATITVQTVAVNSGSASAALPLTAGDSLDIGIFVTAPDRTTASTYTVTVTRAESTTTAALTGTLTLTEANLFAGTAMATMTLTGTEFEAGVAAADFSLSDDVPGTVSVTGVTRDSVTGATLTLAYSGADITANGALIMTLLASGHTGSGNLAAGSLAITASDGTNICGRTAEVRDRLLVVLTPPDCTAVPVAGLAGIGQLALNFRAVSPFRDITALQPGDFAGLTEMTGLSLSGNSLTTLPATIFDGLNNVTRIALNGNDLITLPATIFDGVNALQTLSLYENPTLTAGTGLPAGIFDDVLDTLGDIVEITSASTAEEIAAAAGLVVDANARAAHFVCSRDNFAAIVSATTDVDDCLLISSAQLTAFTNADASLSALTISPGALRPAFDPATTAYDVAVADSVATVTITPTANESAATITVNGNTVDSGAASDAITLTSGTAVPVTVVVTAGDGSTVRTYTVMVTRGAPAAVLAVGTPLTEASLFGIASNRRAQVDLERSEFVATADLTTDDFTVSDTLDGTVSLASVQRTGASRALLTLEHSGEDITANGAISVTVLESGHTGSGDLLTNTIPITASTGANICGRTAQVRDTIVALPTTASECTSITNLATITNLNIATQSITALQSGDFAGMSGLGSLDLSGNSLSTLPADIFDGLTALSILSLSNTGLSSLNPNTFAGLSALIDLGLGGNSLSTLPDGIFAGLTGLLILRLETTGLSSLNANTFAGLTTLRQLNLERNSFTPGTGLPAGIFDDVIGPLTLGAFNIDDTVRAAHFVCSSPLADLIVAATSGVTDCIRITTAQLAAFQMTDTSLSALTISDGVLTPGFDRAINAYTVAVQNSVASVTITPTANQGAATITVQTVAVTNGSASDPLDLVAGTPLVVDIEVTALDGSTTGAHTVTVTRAATGGASAALSGMITEANLFAGAAIATMTLTDTGFESGVAPADFGISDTIDGDLSIAAVTVAAGSTLTATIMLTHSGGDITTSGELSITLLAAGHTGSGNLAAGSVNVMASAGAYVCDRTAAVQAAIVTASANDNCTGITDLATITALDLSNRGITRLQDGDLDGLDALATLALAGNPFTAGGLPAGIFDGVLNTLGDVGTAFTVDNAVRQAHFICSRADGGAIVSATAGVTDCLRITQAQLAAFPAIDASLSALTLSVGDLMPAFDPATTNYNVGVGDVESVTVTPTANQSGATITVNGADVDSGSASVAVTLTANMPETITIQVTATDTSTTRDYVVMVTRGGASATLARGTSEPPLTEAGMFSDRVNDRTVVVLLERTEFVPATELGPDDFTVSDTVDGTVSVNLAQRTAANQTALVLEYTGTDITADGTISITVLASAHTGSDDLLTNPLPITASTGANVCGRTPQVRDAITGSGRECTSITDLATITTLNLTTQNIAALQSGDFAGMSGLQQLNLGDNSISTLPADIFAGLTALAILSIDDTGDLSSLDANTFAGLTMLVQLDLSRNQLTALPAGIFDGLRALQILSLSTNQLEELPAGIFDELDSLNSPNFRGNRFTPGTGLPAGIFDEILDTVTGMPGSTFNVDDNVRNAHFVCSLPIADLVVAATTDVDDCIRISTAQLAAFGMVDTSLSALTVSDGILTPAFDPTVDTYTVAVQLGVTSVTITPTANQDGATITVAGTPVPSGSSIAVPASPDALTAGLALAIAIEVTAPDTTTTDIYTVTATRGGPGMTPPRADVSGTITESDLFAGTAVVTMTLRETEFVAAADLMPDDFGLSDTVEGDLSIAGVTRDSTTAATIMLAHSGEDITAGELILDLLATGHTGSGTLPAGSVNVTVSDGAYVCDRTAAVRDAITTASAGDDCTNITDLDTITALDLSNQGINRLQDGDLDGLDALATLALAGNPFTAGGLPAGIFDDVVDTLGDVGTAFTVDNAVRQAHFICSRADGGAIVAATAGVTDCLRITEAQLTAFPAIDASLRALTLSAGDLMPAFDPAITNYNVGVDAGSVTVTPTANQSGATISVNGATVASGSASVAVPLVAGTAVPITIQVTATDTSTTRDYVVMVTRGGASAVLLGDFDERGLFGSAATRRTAVSLARTEFVPTAELGPDDFMVTETLDGTLSVASVNRLNATDVFLTMEYSGDDITADGVYFVTVLASAHTGSGDLITNTQRIIASTGVNVCDRTPQVRSTLVNTSSATECTSITDLATITQLVLNGQGIPALRSGDFAGMSGLTNLQMNNNRFTTLPADIFSGLTALDRLTMRTGQLTTLPPGIFAGLTALDRLEMNGNRLETLPVGIFSDLSALDRLFLQANRFASLDTGVFDGLNMITDLSLTANPFTPGTGLPAGIFDDILDTAVGLGIQIGAAGVAAHFVCSLPIADLVVAATAGVDFCQFISTEQLTNFAMVDTSLSALTISSGDALIPGFAPGVTAYTVGVLNRFDPITVTPTASQPGAMITVQGNDVNSGSASAAIMLDEGTPVPIEIIVTAPDTTTMQTITVTATREGAPTAELAGTLTEANLFAATAPTVTVTLTGTDYVEAGELMPDDFAVTDGLTDGTVSITEVARTSNRVATLTLGYDRVDITADGRLAVTVLETAHSDSGNLGAGGIDITASPGTNVCGRTAQVVTAIVGESAATECTSIADLATITAVSITGRGITSLQDGDFAGMSGLTNILVANTDTLNEVSANAFADLSELTVLSLFSNALTTLPAGVFDDLSALDDLSIRNNNLASLPAGIFDSLGMLTRLSLAGNSFTRGTGLPAGVFDGILDTLTVAPGTPTSRFGVDNNVRDAHFICIRDDADAIVAFTSGVDDCLRISTADLNAFFASDATLSALTISDGALSPAFNPATITYTVAVLSGVENVMVTPTASQSSSAIITVAGATVASGATSNAIAVAEGTMAIPIVVTPPDGMSSMVTYTINVTRPAMGGATAVLAGTLTEANLFARAATATVTLMGTEYVSGLSADDFTLSADVPGTVSLMSVVRTSTTVATLTLSHSGGDIIAADGELMMNLLASGHTGATALATNGLVITPSDGMNICDRTEAVRDAIVDGSPAAVCTDVTDSDLASITSLDLSGGVVTTLQSGDFAGLTALTSLNLSGDLFNQANRLSALPADIFAGLTALQTLNLSNNNLTTLDANQFAGLTMLTSLNLTSNSLAALDAGQFTGLTMLTDLNLQGNNINALDAGQFTGLTALTSLDLQNNPLGALDAGQFTGLTALETLGLRSTQLDELDAGQFADLSALMILDLARNNLDELDANQFADLTGLTDLFLNSNALASLPPTIFADLSALRILQLSNNGLTALDADQFDGLTRLDLLNLGSNQFTTLPADLFDGLERLTTLSLQFINTFTPATGLPAGIFDDVLDTLGGIGTAFEVDADARAAHFVCSRGDADVVVAATTNVDDCLRITDMQLTAFASTDASLSELTLSDGDLVPAFDPAITDYTVAVADDVAMVTVTPTARQTSATITVNDADVNSGEASAAIMLTAGTPAVFTVVVTATDTTTTMAYGVTVTRGGATATLAGTVNEAALFATPAPTVTVTLLRSEYAGTLVAGNFMLSDTIDGTVSITGVARTSTTVATLTLGYDNVDVTAADGTLSVTVLATGHTGSGSLSSLSLPIAQSSGANVCGRTAEVRDRIVGASSASECTSITDLATITTLGLDNMMIATLQSGDFAGLTGLTTLRLGDNRLTTLPDDLFNGLSALTFLDLDENQFSTLDANVFAGLSALITLTLGCKQPQRTRCRSV